MRLRLLALALCAALVVTACGDDSGDEAEVVESTTTVADPTTSTTSGDPAVGPPTTRGPAPEVTVEPLGELGGMSVLSGEPAYHGVLGQVDPDRYVVAPVALEPVAAADGIAPLTGLPTDDPTLADRPALLVKIDNTSKGRPQESLALADLVYEEMIEGGFTRLAAVFHTNAPELGPIRSGRTTDIALLGSLNRPVFAWSGANRVHAALLRRQDMIDLGAQSRNEYSRASDRPGTYNLMAEAQTLFDLAVERDNLGQPLPQFEYVNDEVGLPSTAEAATSFTVTFPSATVEWAWDAAATGWARTQNGTEHLDAQGEPVIARNVLVAEVGQVATGSVDTANSTVYEQVFLGSGRGWVFTDGHMVEVTWTKPSILSVATWTTPDGIPVAITPGLTWVELAPEGALTTP